MSKLIFDFNYEKMQHDGVSKDTLLKPMRQHAELYGIEEVEEGVFEKEGKNGLIAMMVYIMSIMDNNLSYLSYLNSWTLERPGHVEDVKAEILRINHLNNGITDFVELRS